MKKIEILHLLDIGNTSATYARSIKNKLSRTEFMACDEIPEKIRICSKKGDKFENIVIVSSVVPKNTQKIKSDLFARGNYTIYEIDKDIPVALKNKYENIKKLGIDRKINAYGAIRSKKTPCLVFDYGTALTCDLIDAQNVFLGGLIIPGPATSLKSLLNQTALLPKAFKLQKESGRAYGRNTHECIQHGLIQAYAAMTDGLIAKFSKEFKKKPHIIITGGFSSLIGKIIHSKAEVNSTHTLESILRLYQDWKKT